MSRREPAIEVLDRRESARWDKLVSDSPHGTVFHYSWWLQATGYDFEILVCRDEQGELAAGIPLPRKKHAGLTLFCSPPLTPFLGPVFDLSRGATIRQRLSLMRRTGEALARTIKGYDSFSYGVGPVSPDLQGFLWAGFRAELGYTLRFEAGITLEQVMEGMAPNHRHELVKADRRHLKVEVGENVDAFIDLNRQTFARQGRALPFEEGLPRRLWAAARSRGSADIYLASTSEGCPVAGLLVVHDARSSYLLMAGGNPETRGSGGGNLIEWHAIRDCILAGRSFDFEGSVFRGVEQHYRHWGAEAKPIWQLERTGTLKGALARSLIHMRDFRRWL